MSHLPGFKSSAVRLALRYALVQVLVLALALGAWLAFTFNYVHREIAHGLQQDMDSLRLLPNDVLQARVMALQVKTAGAHRGRDYLLWLADGTQIGATLKSWPQDLPLDGQVHQQLLDFANTNEERDTDAVVPVIASELADGARLLVAQQPGGLEDMRDMLPQVALGLLLLSAGLSLGLGVMLGWRWTQRVDAIRHTSAEIMRGDLSARVPQSGQGDEFDALSTQLNAMLQRIEQAVGGMRDVSDHIAHDLRKPLSRLKNRLELAQAWAHGAAPHAQAVEQELQAALLDVDEMMQAFEAMLFIARLEAGSERLDMQDMELGAKLAELVTLYADEAEDAGRVFEVQIKMPMMVRASWPLLGRAFANVLDNAMLHTAPHVALAVSAQALRGQAIIEIIDHGAGIAFESRAAMLQRFVRGEHARTLPGSGLGLTLARAVLLAHQGDLVLDDTKGGGLTVRMSLPLLGAKDESDSV